MKAKPLTHILILGLCFGLTLSVRGLMRERYRAEQHELESRARAKHVQQLTAFWNSSPYSQVVPEEISRALLSATNIVESGLTTEQQASLKTVLSDVFGYLERPTLESYLCLNRKERDLPLSSEADLRGSTQCATARPSPGENPAPAATLASWWASAVRNSPGGLTGICPKSIRSAVVLTNALPAIVLKGPVAQGFTVAKTAPSPGLCDMGGEAHQKAGRVGETNLLLSFLARSAASTNAAPVYLSLSWSERAQRWVPAAMFSDALLKLDSPF